LGGITVVQATDKRQWKEFLELPYRLYRADVGPALRVSCSLKSIARLVGFTPIDVDRSRIHDLSHEILHAYAASDARLARVLTERRWPTALRYVDRFDRGSLDRIA
jgi:hypothetical protein